MNLMNTIFLKQKFMFFIDNKSIMQQFQNMKPRRRQL